MYLISFYIPITFLSPPFLLPSPASLQSSPYLLLTMDKGSQQVLTYFKSFRDDVKYPI